MKTDTMSWVANSQSEKKAYVTRKYFTGPSHTESFLPYGVNENYGVRPKIVISSDTLVADGDGTKYNTYVFGESKKAKGGTRLNTRFSGEIVKIGGLLWKILETNDDGTTKVIMLNTLGAGKKVSQCTEKQYDAVAVICDELKDKVAELGLQ